jgi:hypothetical protein
MDRTTEEYTSRLVMVGGFQMYLGHSWCNLITLENGIIPSTYNVHVCTHGYVLYMMYCIHLHMQYLDSAKVSYTVLYYVVHI